MEYSIVGNTITMTMDYMDSLIEKVSKLAAETAVERYRQEQLKNEKLRSSEAAKRLGVTKATVVNYIKTGKRVGCAYIKLKAENRGRDYIVNAMELEEFKERLN